MASPTAGVVASGMPESRTADASASGVPAGCDAAPTGLGRVRAEFETKVAVRNRARPGETVFASHCPERRSLGQRIFRVGSNRAILSNSLAPVDITWTRDAGTSHYDPDPRGGRADRATI